MNKALVQFFFLFFLLKSLSATDSAAEFQEECPPCDESYRLARPLDLGQRGAYLNHMGYDLAGMLGGRLLNLAWETNINRGQTLFLSFASYSKTLSLHHLFYRWKYQKTTELELESGGIELNAGLNFYLHPGQIRRWFVNLVCLMRTLALKGLQTYFSAGLESRIGYRFFIKTTNRWNGIQLSCTPFIALALFFVANANASSAFKNSHAFRSALTSGSFPLKLVAPLQLQGAGLLALQARFGLSIGLFF